VGRANKSTRLEPLNGLTLCFMCHRESSTFSAHKTPEKFMRWFKKLYAERWDFIKKAARVHMTERDAVEEFKTLIQTK
jgi:hypothetical protein